MAQKTSWTGATIVESDITTYLMHEGGAWTSWTPTVGQNGAVTKTNTRSRYGRASRLIYGQAYCTITGAGNANQVVTITVPVAMSASDASTTVGEGWIYDSSTGFFHYGMLQYQTSTTVAFLRRVDGSAGLLLGTSSFTAALASGDIVHTRFLYESSS